MNLLSTRSLTANTKQCCRKNGIRVEMIIVLCQKAPPVGETSITSHANTQRQLSCQMEMSKLLP